MPDRVVRVLLYIYIYFFFFFFWGGGGWYVSLNKLKITFTNNYR